MNRPGDILTAGVAIFFVAAAATGCGRTATDLPLPGGGVKGETYRLTAVFDEALNLPGKAQVKLDGVRVGEVTEIEADDYTARVEMKILDSVSLPVGTTAELRQATPLGDVFVSLTPPTKKKQGADTEALVDGQIIELESTSAAATTEDLLGGLSMLINGGGLNQLGTITEEGNLALDGRGGRIRHLIDELTQTIRALNRRTNDIDRVLDAAAGLSKIGLRRERTIQSALDDFEPAIRVLKNQTEPFLRALQALSQVSGTTSDLAVRGGPDMVAAIKNIGPIADGFADLDGDLAPTLQTILDFGEVWALATKGEAITGDARVTGVANIPGIDGGIPAPEDATRAAASVLASLARLIDELKAP